MFFDHYWSTEFADFLKKKVFSCYFSIAEQDFIGWTEARPTTAVGQPNVCLCCPIDRSLAVFRSLIRDFR